MQIYHRLFLFITADNGIYRLLQTIAVSGVVYSAHGSCDHCATLEKQFVDLFEQARMIGLQYMHFKTNKIT